jgi:hypothetical protein
MAGKALAMAGPRDALAGAKAASSLIAEKLEIKSGNYGRANAAAV